MMSSEIVQEIDAADICERLVGITPVYLQNFLQRGSYGLRSSVSPGKVRSQRRLFSVDDVYGFALVWLLFEAGLRGDPIARILNEVADTKKANANSAAAKLLTANSDYLVVSRMPRRPSKTLPEKPTQRVEVTMQKSLLALLKDHPGETALIIPVGEKFSDVQKRLELLFNVR